MTRAELNSYVFYSIGVLSAGLYEKGRIKDYQVKDVISRVSTTMDDFAEYYTNCRKLDNMMFSDIVGNYYIPKLEKWYGEDK